MAFTFNWAGTRINPINRYDSTKDYSEFASNVGTAARGLHNEMLDREYAGMIEGRNSALARMDELSAQISRLEGRNAEIRRMLSGMQQEQVQPSLPVQPEGIHGQPAAYPYTNFVEERPGFDGIV